MKSAFNKTYNAAMPNNDINNEVAAYMTFFENTTMNANATVIKAKR